MSYLKDYNLFTTNEGNNQGEKISVRVIKNISWLRNIISNAEGLYMPFQLKNRKAFYEVSRLISELLETSIFDVMRIYISKIDKEGVDGNSTTFSDFSKSRTKINIQYNLNYINKLLTHKNVKFTLNREREMEILKMIQDVIRGYGNIIGKLDNKKLDSSLLVDFRKLGELILKINSTSQEQSVNESYKYEDTGFAIGKIKEKYTREEIDKMLEKEIKAWVDEDWSDNFDSESDWYYVKGNGEAEEIIIDRLVDWFTEAYNRELDEEEDSELRDEIEREYNL